jgi:hypothetical protein
MASIHSAEPAAAAQFVLDDPDRGVCLGPDTFLLTPPGQAPTRAAVFPPTERSGSDWFLELFEAGGETVRVLFADGGEQ